MNAFTSPRTKKIHTRVPRKFKKKHKLLLNKYSFLTLNQKIWYILGETNKPYRDFLISEITKTYNS